MSELRYVDLGRQAYQPTLRLQRRLVRRVQAEDPQMAYLLMVEHDPPAITLGRRGRAEHILASPEALAAKGLEVCRVRRGGGVTWHGPGQLVVYPILSLRCLRRPLHRYVHELEETLIWMLARFSITARRRHGFAGVWVGQEKIAAIGLAVDRWVCYHGFALNVCPDLAWFDVIVPCGPARGPGGLGGCRMTSMARLLGRAVQVAEVKSPLLECLGEALGMQIVAAEAAELGADDREPPHADRTQAPRLAQEAAAALPAHPLGAGRPGR